MTRKKSEAERIYRITFQNQGKVYEMYAKEVSSSGMFGFVEVAHFVFGERSQVIVDSSEEALKTEFAGVKRAFVPLHAVIRIDEVEREGPARITSAEKGDAKVTAFPLPMPQPRGEKK
jgi:hypothetical protein